MANDLEKSKNFMKSLRSISPGFYNDETKRQGSRALAISDAVRGSNYQEMQATPRDVLDHPVHSTPSFSGGSRENEPTLEAPDIDRTRKTSQRSMPYSMD